MQSMLSGILVFSAIIYGTLAQKKGEIPSPVHLLPSKHQPTTPPRLIDESDRKKECPAGFHFMGKQCAKTVTAPPEALCPPGTISIDGRCVKYVGKDSECPSGFILSNGACIKKHIEELQVSCPPGFEFINNECIKKVALPEIKECPVDSLLKGDLCVKGVTEPPYYVCPAGFIQIGKKCQRESTFDCTPVRKPRQIPEEKKGEMPLLRSPSKGKEENVYRLPASAPTVEEYVIQETCKRVITEAARAICPDEGSFNGKLCEKDIIVPELTRPGGLRTLKLPPLYECPEGYVELNKEKECVNIEFAPPNLFCPPGTIDLGDKCAIYSNPKSNCPEGFYLDGKICTKTIFAAPLVEYTRTYACTGKDCGHHGK